MPAREGSRRSKVSDCTRKAHNYELFGRPRQQPLEMYNSMIQLLGEHEEVASVRQSRPAGKKRKSSHRQTAKTDRREIVTKSA